MLDQILSGIFVGLSFKKGKRNDKRQYRVIIGSQQLFTAPTQELNKRIVDLLLKCFVSHVGFRPAVGNPPSNQ